MKHFPCQLLKKTIIIFILSEPQERKKRNERLLHSPLCSWRGERSLWWQLIMLLSSMSPNSSNVAVSGFCVKRCITWWLAPPAAVEFHLAGLVSNVCCWLDGWLLGFFSGYVYFLKPVCLSCLRNKWPERAASVLNHCSVTSVRHYCLSWYFSHKCNMLFIKH